MIMNYASSILGFSVYFKNESTISLMMADLANLSTPSLPVKNLHNAQALASLKQNFNKYWHWHEFKCT